MLLREQISVPRVARLENFGMSVKEQIKLLHIQKIKITQKRSDSSIGS